MEQLIKKLVNNAILKLQQENKFPLQLKATVKIEPTRNSEHGDFATNIALLLAKEIGTKPLAIAEAIVAEITLESFLKGIDIANPGFINFHLAENAFFQNVAEILTTQDQFAHTNIGHGKMVMVEYVSANPTGPLHVGHGRGAAFGATISDLLTCMGYKVHREYYVNDAGRQMHVLAISIWLRYLAFSHELPHFPASSYKGNYIIEIAEKLKVEYGEKFNRQITPLFADLPTDEKDGGDKEFYIDALVKRAQAQLGANDYQTIFNAGIETILADIREDLEEFGVIFQQWFNESQLILNKDVERGIEKLRQHGHVYEKDGALWFRATAFGDGKDRVLVRANGQTTYFASDVGYHLNKFERGFDKIIDVFGSDHHGYAPRVKAFLTALELTAEKLEILLVQFANLFRGKQRVSMSTRSGEFVTLRELRHEVGNDAARFFYIMRKNDQHLDFDLELAKSQSADNPIYYIQYAHARICSVLRQATEKKLLIDEAIGLKNLHLLSVAVEKNLLRRLLRYKLLLKTAALNYEPHLLAHFLRDLANDLHTYYNAEQFLVTDVNMRNARLCLITATKQILANGLRLLGCVAPEAM